MEKDLTQIEIHANFRKELWCRVYVGYVSAANATNKNGAYQWADIALNRFDERFKLSNEHKQIRPDQKHSYQFFCIDHTYKSGEITQHDGKAYILSYGENNKIQFSTGVYPDLGSSEWVCID